MAVPAQVQNVTVDQADGNILISWTGALGATDYLVYRSTDGVNFTQIANPSLVTQYVDSFPGVGIMYYYRVAANNGSGAGTVSLIAQMVAAPPSEMSLYELRLRSQQAADRVNSNFVSNSEWNSFLRLACYELYDILVTSFEDWYAQNTVSIQTDGSNFLYPLPNGYDNYLGGEYTGASGNPAGALYKLAGVDLNVNTSILTPSRVTLLRFNFIKRNNYVYPNSTSTIYGVYNMRYRLMGSNLMITPTPAQGQNLLLWYTPKLPALLQDTDCTTIGISGWLRYVIVRAALYALGKDQTTDLTNLQQELLFLKQRIEQAAQNRDEGQADTISETRVDPAYGGSGFGSYGGGQAGW